MRISKGIVWNLLPLALLVTVLSVGCKDHQIYHDPYYEDDHPVATEQRYYNQWEQETHREHQDLSKRTQDEQKQYWDWRHRRH